MAVPRIGLWLPIGERGRLCGCAGPRSSKDDHAASGNGDELRSMDKNAPAPLKSGLTDRVLLEPRNLFFRSPVSSAYVAKHDSLAWRCGPRTRRRHGLRRARVLRR